MAEPAQSHLRIVGGTAESPTVDAERLIFSGGTGGGGGSGVDAETLRFVESKMETVKAQNDARFAEVLAGIGRVDDRVSHLAPPITWQQLALTIGSVGLVLIGVVFAVLAYASDRFDGGISASGLLDEFSQVQADRDIAQDAKSDEIILLLKELASRLSAPAP